jgi:hypothetical protein
MNIRPWPLIDLLCVNIGHREGYTESDAAKRSRLRCHKIRMSLGTNHGRAPHCTIDVSMYVTTQYLKIVRTTLLLGTSPPRANIGTI